MQNHKTWLLQHGYFKSQIGENVMELIETLEDQGLTQSQKIQTLLVFIKLAKQEEQENEI